jgi:hypothetical protein
LLYPLHLKGKDPVMYWQTLTNQLFAGDAEGESPGLQHLPVSVA